MATITTYMVQCPSFGDFPPHVFEVLKTTADTILSGSQGYLVCPICKTNIPASIAQANTLTSTT